jgi:hypothetical protein
VTTARRALAALAAALVWAVAVVGLFYLAFLGQPREIPLQGVDHPTGANVR